MDDTQAEKAIGVLKGLFDNWHPSLQQERFWRKQFAKFSYEAVLKSIDTTRAETNSYKPPAKSILAYCEEFQKKESFHHQQTQPTDNGVLAYSLQCVDHPKKHKIGQVMEFFHPVSRTLPDGDTLMRWAENKCKGVERVYGGLWAIIRDFDNAPAN